MNYIENIYYVYKWVRKDTNEIFYIGKGKGNRYKSIDSRNKCCLEVVSLIGKENISMEIIKDHLSEDKAFELEKYYIKYYLERGEPLTNRTQGGLGSSNWYDFLSEDEKLHHREISKSFLGRKHTEETKEKMRKIATGRKLSGETKHKLSVLAMGRPSGMKGKHHSLETKKKLSEQHKGKPSPFKGITASDEFKKLVSEKLKQYFQTHPPNNCKPIQVIDSNGDIILNFKSISECASYFEKTTPSLSKACIKVHLRNGKPINSQYEQHKKYKGWKFVYSSNIESSSTIESIGNEKHVVE